MAKDPKKKHIAGSEYYRRQSFTQTGSTNVNKQRLTLFKYLVGSCFLIIALRAIYVLAIPPSEAVLAKLSQRQYERKIELSGYRGTIFDRKREPLALSTRKPSLFVNPRIFSPTKEQTRLLSKYLDISVKKIKSIQKKQSYFSWLARKTSRINADRVLALKIDGLDEIMEPSRSYPTGLAAQLIGYVGTDNEGLIGLEKVYENELRGETNAAQLQRDAKGRLIYDAYNSASPQKSGNSLHLTIDQVIQEITENALKKQVRAAKAKSGLALVADPHTGQLLAIANYPSFKPNDSSSINSINTRNFALLNRYEPGSTLKPFVVGAALEENLVEMDTSFELDKGTYREDNWKIRDSHPHDALSVKEILARSSNIGTYKIAKKGGPERLYELYKRIGIGDRALSLNFHSQAFGYVAPWRSWRSVRFANLSFGQGFYATPLEILSAYNAIANGGQLVRPHLIRSINDATGKNIYHSSTQVLRTVFSSSVGEKIKSALVLAVKEGTSKRAQSASYTTAGKTGTSEKVDPKTKSYSSDLRLASFAGFAPVADPHLSVYVAIDEPKVKPYYGGVWAAPVFKEIVDQSLKYLNVRPDNVITKTLAKDTNHSVPSSTN